MLASQSYCMYAVASTHTGSEAQCVVQFRDTVCHARHANEKAHCLASVLKYIIFHVILFFAFSTGILAVQAEKHGLQSSMCSYVASRAALLPSPNSSPLFFACLVAQRLINSPFALLSHSDLESK